MLYVLLCGLYRYVWPQRVWFFKRFGQKLYQFWSCWSQIGQAAFRIDPALKLRQVGCHCTPYFAAAPPQKRGGGGGG